MRLLLFFVSALFSFIFYSFYNLTQWKSIFLQENYSLEVKNLLTLLWIESSLWLLFFSICFLVIWIFFVVYFTPIETNTKKIKIDKTKLYYSFFYVFLLTPVYFWIFNNSKIVLFFVLIFIIWDFCFNHLPKISFFKKYKLNLKYYWLFINYIIVICSIFHIFILDFSYFLFLILIYSIIFNYNIHKKYINYVSLFFSIIITFFIFFYLFLKIQDLYIELVSYF